MPLVRLADLAVAALTGSTYDLRPVVSRFRLPASRIRPVRSTGSCYVAGE